MSDGHVWASAPAPRVRAGFWRRAWAFLVDIFVVSVPIQIVVAALYPMTNGAIQTTSGINFSICQNANGAAAVPAGLDPPPPAGANYMSICRSSFFGLETARWLTVGRVTREGAFTKKVWRNYALDRANKPRKAFAADWIAYLALFIYLVALENGLGATLGKMWLGLRVIDTRQADRRGIPLGKSVARNLLLWIGTYPMLVALLVALLIGPDMLAGLERLMQGGMFSWFMLCALLAAAIIAWIVVAVARKRDPIYDRIARTAVVRA